MSTVTTRQAIERWKEFDRVGFRKAVARAFYRSLDRGRQSGLAALKRSTVGQMVDRRGQVQLQLGLASRKKFSAAQLAGLASSTIPLVLRRLKVQPSMSGGFIGGLETMGFAALIEAGGRTASHQIKRIRLGGYSRRFATRARQVEAQPPLTFQVGGRWVTKRVVSHPGSRIPRTPFMNTATHAAALALGPEYERSIGEEIAKAGI